MKTVIIVKGSFNPIHNGHLNSALLLKRIIPNSTVVFMISINTFDKGTGNNILERVKMINSLGYPVIINRSGFFKDNAEFLFQKFDSGKIAFLVGSDTVNRLLSSSYNIIDPPPEKNISKKQIQGITCWAFKLDFHATKFYFLERSGIPVCKEIEFLNGDKLFGDYFISLGENNYVDISSTTIRKLKEEGNLKQIRNLIPEKIYNYYLNEK